MTKLSRVPGAMNQGFGHHARNVVGGLPGIGIFLCGSTAFKLATATARDLSGRLSRSLAEEIKCLVKLSFTNHVFRDRVRCD